MYGLLFPNGVIPSISGPVQEESSYSTTFGSAAGALFSWEPFDFGLRDANVDLAEAIRNRSQAGSDAMSLEVSLAVVDAYLRALANQQAVEVARATVERMGVFAESVGVLVENELRPGADESRAIAELSRAERELIRAEEEAQRLLRQAEVEDALARLGVWRALFALAGARGEIGDLLRLGSH